MHGHMNVKLFQLIAVYTIYKSLQHVSGYICSHLQGLLTKVVCSSKHVTLSEIKAKWAFQVNYNVFIGNIQ